MDNDDGEHIGRALEGLRREVRALREQGRWAAMPQAFSYPDAAKQLGVSPATVKRMVRRRELTTIVIGERPKVPLAEIQRLTAVPVKLARGNSSTAKQEATRLRAALKRRR